MRQVIQKAQELAEAILESDVYRAMKTAEMDMRRDEDASRALETMIARRQRVEDILSSNQMDPAELKAASADMEAAEARMNANEKIQALKDARKDFQTMMDNVNQILRLVITGETDDGKKIRRSGCGGSCAGCDGCG